MKKERVAVSMEQYGINTVVVTHFDELERMRLRFENKQDNTFFNGQGKAALYEHLLDALKKEDAYFDAHLDLPSPKNKRWLNFLDDCVILTVLGACLRGNPIYLMRPEEYKKFKQRALCSTSTATYMDLMDTLPNVMQKNPIAEALANH